MSNLSPAHIDALLVASLTLTIEEIRKSIEELTASSKIAVNYIQSGFPYSGTFRMQDTCIKLRKLSLN